MVIRARPAAFVPLSALLTGALTLSACGGDGETKTVTVGQTGQQTQTTAPPMTTAPPATTETAPPQPMPPGTVLYNGDYNTWVTKIAPAGIAAGGESQLAEGMTWSITTTCTGTEPGSCTLALRRGLYGGGIKELTLKQDAAKPGQFFTDTMGKARCGGAMQDAKQTLRVRPVREENGAATTFEAFYRAKKPCGSRSNAVAIYRGRLTGPPAASDNGAATTTTPTEPAPATTAAEPGATQ